MPHGVIIDTRPWQGIQMWLGFVPLLVCVVPMLSLRGSVGGCKARCTLICSCASALCYAKADWTASWSCRLELKGVHLLVERSRVVHLVHPLPLHTILRYHATFGTVKYLSTFVSFPAGDGWEPCICCIGLQDLIRIEFWVSALNVLLHRQWLVIEPSWVVACRVWERVSGSGKSKYFEIVL